MSGTDHIHPIYDQFGRQRNFDFCAEVAPTETWPYMLWINPTTREVKVRDKNDAGWVTVSGGGAGAPTDAQYLVLAFDPGLAAERRLVAGDGLDLTDGGANGDATLDVDVTVVRTAGAQTIGGIKTFSDNIVLDDGAGDSPQIQLVGGTNADTALIYLDDAPTAGESDIVIKLAGVGTDSLFKILTSLGGVLAHFGADGHLTLAGGDLTLQNGKGTFLRYGSPAIRGWIVDGVTAGVSKVLELRHISSGSVAAGFGARILYELEDGSANTDDAAAIDAGWNDPTHGSEDSYIRFLVRTAGAALAETCRLDGAGLLMAAGKSIDLVNAINEFSIDGTLAGNSDLAIPTEKAVKTYVDNNAPTTTWHYARAKNSTKSVPHATWTRMDTFSTEEFDRNPLSGETRFNPSTGRFTSHQKGFYLCSAACTFNSSSWVAGSNLGISLYKNGTRYADLTRLLVSAAVTSYIGANGTTLVQLDDNDYVEFWILQSSGSGKSLLGGDVFNWVSIAQVNEYA